jgi:hypothetical protein
MRAPHAYALAWLVCAAPWGWCQTPAESSDPLVVGTEHPRLFLRPARLRLLRRERERQSLRWQQFSRLLAGGAQFPEPGFALALDYAVAGDREAGLKATAFALTSTDLRQMALVYDWCEGAMSGADRTRLAARIARRMAETAADQSVAAVRSRLLGAVTLFDEVPDLPGREFERDVRGWWPTKVAEPLSAGKVPFQREDAYPLLELLHAVQDNLNLDLRESNVDYFKDFPVEHLMSYYPAPYRGAENEFYIGAASTRSKDPDLEAAALSRAADLAMVAYDTNAPQTQVLQGWLMHDRFLLRGAFGAPYEFLWADPYQPGLSYYHVPTVYYNPDYGRLFARSSWDDDAAWFGLFDGGAQLFADGHVTMVDPRVEAPPLALDDATVCFGRAVRDFELTLEDRQTVFVVGLEPRRSYDVEVDDEQMYQADSDRAGIVELDDVPAGKPVEVHLRERTVKKASR